MPVHKIVVTGGPCGGKTTALSRIKIELSRLGYTVLVVPESATQLNSNGITPWGCITTKDYQRCQMRLQVYKEQIYDEAAAVIPSDKIVIVCDRGMLDNRAYMTDEEFCDVLAEQGWSEVALRESYDAVFHLVSCARGAEKYYQLENNGARYESLEEAREMDDSFIAAWASHPYYRIIDNSTGFEEKMDRLIKEVVYFLGEHMERRIEHKYLIEYPDLAWLDALPSSGKINIVQTYLRSEPDREVRLRSRGTNDDDCVYYLTEKQIEGEDKRLLHQRHLNKGEYRMMLHQADPDRREIRKTRYSFTHGNLYIDVDVYPCWDDQAVAKVEVSSEDAVVCLPEELHVIREITGEEAYRDSVMASQAFGATH